MSPTSSRKGCAGGLLDLADRGLDRAGERALLVPEQFGFEQVFGDRRAIDRDEGATAAVALLVQPAREQLLAGPARAEQHHRDIGVGNALDRPRGLHHLRIAGDHAAQYGVILARFLAETRVLALDLLHVERAADDQRKVVDLDRLAVEIISALRDRIARALPLAMARGDDDLGIGLQPQDFRQRREAFAHPVGIGRQAQIERDDIGLFIAQQVDRARPVAGA